MASGHDVAVARSSQEAMSLLESMARTSRPVVVLLDADIVPPGRLETLARELRDKDVTERLAVVLIGTTDEDGLPYPRLRSLCATRLSRPLEPRALRCALEIAATGFYVRSCAKPW
jgi:hypothetical protein